MRETELFVFLAVHKLLLHVHLTTNQRRIRAVWLLNQLRMVALLYNLPILNNEYDISISDRTQSMGNYHDCHVASSGKHVINRLLDHSLGLSIEG
mmetsp:Transcript_35424/g.100905  ORF Transcript_35424/g.100905 Transcript_35424/m.100905 type:complete len:95 (-) Transcript_35424:91-375(-)